MFLCHVVCDFTYPLASRPAWHHLFIYWSVFLQLISGCQGENQTCGNIVKSLVRSFCWVLGRLWNNKGNETNIHIANSESHLFGCLRALLMIHNIQLYNSLTWSLVSGLMFANTFGWIRKYALQCQPADVWFKSCEYKVWLLKNHVDIQNQKNSQVTWKPLFLSRKMEVLKNVNLWFFQISSWPCLSQNANSSWGVSSLWSS